MGAPGVCVYYHLGGAQGTYSVSVCVACIHMCVCFFVVVVVCPSSAVTLLQDTNTKHSNLKGKMHTTTITRQEIKKQLLWSLSRDVAFKRAQFLAQQGCGGGNVRGGAAGAANAVVVSSSSNTGSSSSNAVNNNNNGSSSRSSSSSVIVADIPGLDWGTPLDRVSVREMRSEHEVCCFVCVHHATLTD